MAGAVFGEVGGWLCLLHALEWRFLCDADHCWHSFCVAGAVFGQVGVWVSWQAQHLVQFWEIAGARNVVFFNTKSSPRSQGEGLRSGGCEMTILSSDYRRIILGSCSNHLSIGGSTSGSFRSNLELQDLVAGAVLGEFPRWLYLLRALEMTFHMSRGSMMRFILRGRRSIWWSWSVTFRGRGSIWCNWEIAGARNVVFFNTKSSPRSQGEGLRSGGCEMTISCSDYPRIMLESSFCWRKHFREFPLKSWASRFSGRRSIWWSWRVTLLAPRIGNDVSYVTQINDEIHRRSIWWSWRVTLLAPRIGNDVSYVTRINDEIHFAWQAQYLVKLEGDFTCSAHWKWRFICDADQWCDSMCGAGAVFWWSWRVTLLAPRIGNDVSYVMRINDAIQCAGQAQ